jgi:hypothetical protein
LSDKRTDISKGRRFHSTEINIEIIVWHDCCMNDDIKELVFGIVVGALFQIFSWTIFHRKK